MTPNQRNMDKIMLEFPLCCLSYPGNERKKIDLIISYCICERSKKIKFNINNRIDELLEKGKQPYGFSKKSMEHCRILLAAHELGILLGSISHTKDSHMDLLNHISKYEMKHGKDAYCRIGKNLCFEARDGQFPFRQFAIICAIQSILGKTKKYKRITKDRIRYAMWGYKTKAIASNENISSEILLSDRQLGTAIEILHSKKFFSKFTYANRQTFFSTRLSDAELYEAVKNSKVYWKKKKLSLLDKQVTNEIKTELGKLKLIRFGAKLNTGTG